MLWGVLWCLWSFQPSLLRSWILTHLFTCFESDTPEQRCSTWHWWMDTSILLSTIGNLWIILAAEPAQFFFPWLWVTLFSVPAQEHYLCPILFLLSCLLTRPWTPVGFYTQTCGRRRDWNFLFRTYLDRFRHWWAQLREEVQLRDAGNRESVSSCLISRAILRSTYELYWSLHCLILNWQGIYLPLKPCETH